MTTQTEALKLALEALKRIDEAMPFPVAKLAQKTIKEALAQPEQEPMARVCHDLDGHIGWNPKLTQLPDEGTLLYTTPPQRTWVGLTDEEVKKIAYNTAERKVAKDIEAKLKEKNDC